MVTVYHLANSGRLYVLLATTLAVAFSAKSANAQLRWTSGELEGTPRFVAFLPDSKTAISGGTGNQYEIKSWEMEKKKLIGAFANTPDHSSLWSFAISPDGLYVATCGFRQKIQIWQIAQRRLRSTMPSLEDKVQRVAFAPDSRTLAAAGHNGTEFWDVYNRKVTFTIKDQTHVSYLAFSPDGKTLALGRYNGSIVLWDIAGKKIRATLAEHKDQIISLAFSPDGKTLASIGTREEKVILWDVAKGERDRRLPSVFDLWNPKASAFSPDGKVLAVVGETLEGMVQFWDIAAREWRTPVKGADKNTNCVAFSPDGKRFIVSGGDKTIRLFDLPAK